MLKNYAFIGHSKSMAEIMSQRQVIGSGDVTHGNPQGDNAIAVCKSKEVDDLILEQYIQATFLSLETV